MDPEGETAFTVYERVCAYIDTRIHIMYIEYTNAYVYIKGERFFKPVYFRESDG